MPTTYTDGSKRYSEAEAREMYARGEVRWISPEESAERLRLASMPAGAAIRLTVDNDVSPRTGSGWVEPSRATLRERAAQASRARSREAAARRAAKGGGK